MARILTATFAFLLITSQCAAQRVACEMETTILEFAGAIFARSESADIDGDLDPDLIVYNATTETFWIFENQSGQLVFWQELDTGTDTSEQPHLADIDGDGDLDFLTIRSGLMSGIFVRQFVTMVNDGIGNFSDLTAFDVPLPGTPTSIAVGDIDMDSDIDVVVLKSRFPSFADNLQIYLNNGSGLFEGSLQMMTSGFETGDLSLVDVDNDNDLDIVYSCAVINGGDLQTIRALLNNGSGTFSAVIASNFQAVNPFFGRLHFGDLNNDSFLDLVVGSTSFEDEGYVFRIGRGDGGFEPDVLFDKTKRVTSSIGIIDIDRDGLLDLVTTPVQEKESLIRTFLNDGALDSLEFQLDLNVNSGFGPNDILVDDFDSDGFPELCIVYGTGTIRLIQFQCQKVLFGDINLDGIVDLLDVGPFVNLLNDSQFQIEADLVRDQVINLLDIAPFIEILTGQ